jgi:hypothetical protein
MYAVSLLGQVAWGIIIVYQQVPKALVYISDYGSYMVLLVRYCVVHHQPAFNAFDLEISLITLSFRHLHFNPQA